RRQLEERVDLVRLGGDLPSLHDIDVVIAERDGDLPCVLIDAEIEHRRGSPVGRKGQILHLTRWENHFFSTRLLFHRYHRALRNSAWVHRALKPIRTTLGTRSTARMLS